MDMEISFIYFIAKKLLTKLRQATNFVVKNLQTNKSDIETLIIN